MSKVLLLAAFIGFVALSTSQECNPRVVEWLPHPNSCQKFILCFHGNPLELSCAPGLHFSPTDLQCTFPAQAKCDINFMCPENDDENNPVFIPDSIDCRKYFVCFKGTPLPRTCADSLWFDIENSWCTFEDEVTCDERTINNPRNPETTTAVTLPTEPPVISDCFRTSHLFNNDRSYSKSFCMLNISSTYEEAEATCRDRNMNLFVIDSSNTQSTFFTATTYALIQNPSGYLWINGRKESILEWFTFSPERASLYPGIDWVQTETIDGRTSGDCLRYSQQNGPFQAMGASCNTYAWFTCEYSSQPVFSTEMCRNNNQLIDDEGNLLKSTCIVNDLLLYTEAEQTCLQNGMRLFVINNSTVQAAFQRSVTQSLTGITNGFLWINGRRENEEWFSYDPVRSDLYEGVDWVQTVNVDGRVSGDCLRYTAQFGPIMRSMGTDCRNRAWFVCEY